MNDNNVHKITKTLIASSDEKTRDSSQRFFKETIRCHGVNSAVTGQIGKELYQSVKHLPKTEVFGLCEQLWQTGYLEEAFIACNWSYYLHRQYTPDDFRIFEKWVDRYVTNWATCDTLCNHTVGTFVEMYPVYLQELKRWARSENRWMKRAAAVSLIVPARHSKFLPDILEIAGILLLDKDDMVQKGYGWMLKAASQAHQQEVFDYVMRNKAIMPRTSLRYAIEKMPQELRKQAMEK
ncbi:MAG: DNA alkylation repair protein [Bacteroidales bacterium]|nr:DNA alkylation repair protein [Bacteroidales bacterium]